MPEPLLCSKWLTLFTNGLGHRVHCHGRDFGTQKRMFYTTDLRLLPMITVIRLQSKTSHLLPPRFQRQTSSFHHSRHRHDAPASLSHTMTLITSLTLALLSGLITVLLSGLITALLTRPSVAHVSIRSCGFQVWCSDRCGGGCSDRCVGRCGDRRGG